MDVEREVNSYSERWFRTFLDTIDSLRSESEVRFIERCLPREDFPRILDLGCGSGRHASLLAERGYSVTGVDRDAGAIARARAAGNAGARFITADMREVGELDGPWDGILLMWASFGYFSPRENRRFLGDLSRELRPEGRLLLDVYNRDFFSEGLEQRTLSRGSAEVEETRRYADGRLEVALRYADPSTEDYFSWQVFTVEELADLAEGAGLDLIRACSGFGEVEPVRPAMPRMQLLFERSRPFG